MKDKKGEGEHAGDGYGESRGEELWVDGAKYVGKYSNGIKNGYGVYKWTDGSLEGRQEVIGHRKPDTEASIVPRFSVKGWWAALDILIGGGLYVSNSGDFVIE